MIACLYGRAFAPFVEPVARDLCSAAADAGTEMQPLTIERASADPRRCADVQRLYVLPFDVPAASGLPASPATAVRQLFPRAEVITSFAVQDLCWDKVATQERLIDRGLPVPDTLVSSDAADVHEFVREHGWAILKEPRSCGGQGHVVLWMEQGVLYADGGSRRCTVELVADGPRRLVGERLVYPSPFYVQRLVLEAGPRGSVPGQVLRAYVVDSQIVFWTERYREHYARPSDWIINVGSGAKYRFVHDVSEEMKKIALRSAEVIGMRIGVVDLIRAGRSGPYVLEADTDGCHMIVDRQFKSIPEYREFFNLDRYIAEALKVEPEPPRAVATAPHEAAVLEDSRKGFKARR